MAMKSKLVEPESVEKPHGFPPEIQRTQSKFRKLTRQRVTELIQINSYRLKWVLFWEVLLLSGGAVMQFFYIRWYLVIALTFGFISLLIGIWGLIQKNVLAIRIFIVFQSLGVLFTLIGTVLIYWFILDYNRFCSSNVIEDRQSCAPKIAFLLTASFAPFMFILLLFGVIYGLKLARYHKYYLHFSQFSNAPQTQADVNSYAIITGDETGNINPILHMAEKDNNNKTLPVRDS